MKSERSGLPIDDLENICNDTKDIFLQLKESSAETNIFITGGTGFFGKWIIQGFLYARQKLGINNVKATILSRNPEAFLKKFPVCNDPAIKFIQGDVLSFPFPKEKFTHVIHGATAASLELTLSSPLIMFDTIVGGTRRVLDCAKACGVKKFLLLSSGGVYGRQPPNMATLREDYNGAPDCMERRSSYDEAKRSAELLCALYSDSTIEMKIARCFAFVGPYLPLDTHFAIGNFIRDAMLGGPIIVKAQSKVFRSYQYMSDLVVWLFKILENGIALRPYNVGSDEEYSIVDIAHLVASSRALSSERVEVVLHHPLVHLDKESVDAKTHRYIPSIERTQSELGLANRVKLKDAIFKTIMWYKKYQSDVL